MSPGPNFLKRLKMLIFTNVINLISENTENLLLEILSDKQRLKLINKS